MQRQQYGLALIERHTFAPPFYALLLLLLERYNFQTNRALLESTLYKSSIKKLVPLYWDRMENFVLPLVACCNTFCCSAFGKKKSRKIYTILNVISVSISTLVFRPCVDWKQLRLSLPLSQSFRVLQTLESRKTFLMVMMMLFDSLLHITHH